MQHEKGSVQAVMFLNLCKLIYDDEVILLYPATRSSVSHIFDKRLNSAYEQNKDKLMAWFATSPWLSMCEDLHVNCNIVFLYIGGKVCQEYINILLFIQVC